MSARTHAWTSHGLSTVVGPVKGGNSKGGTVEQVRWPNSWLRTSPGRLCPSCGAREGRPILWGMPTFEVFEAAEAGEIDIEIGGCCVSEDDPTHRCWACGARFGTGRAADGGSRSEETGE